MEICTLPKIVAGNKIPTLNGTGYIFYSISPLGKTFIKNEAKPQKTILEIGAGFNNIVIESLRMGIGSYTANDILDDHLNILVERIRYYFGESAEEKLQSLRLLCAKAPTELPFKHRAYDAILADKVIHFMSPEEILQFIRWSRSALKKNGKIYILTASPYSSTYKNRLADYLSRVEQGVKFPGYINEVMNHLDPSAMQNYPQFKVPNQMLLLSRRELIELLEEEGMKVVESFSLRIPTEDCEKWVSVQDDISNVVGVVAINK